MFTKKKRKIITMKRLMKDIIKKDMEKIKDMNIKKDMRRDMEIIKDMNIKKAMEIKMNIKKDMEIMRSMIKFMDIMKDIMKKKDMEVMTKDMEDMEGKVMKIIKATKRRNIELIKENMEVMGDIMDTTNMDLLPLKVMSTSTSGTINFLITTGTI